MNRIFLDLELEQPYTNHQTPDSCLATEAIIQVGYVVMNDVTGEFLFEACRNVFIGVPLSSFIKKLTGISDEDLKTGTDLVTIIDELNSVIKTYNCSRKLHQWGGGDDVCIKAELPKNYPWQFGRSAVNVKHLFQLWSEANGISPSGGLKKSMSKMGLKFEGGAHNALIDAKNTAIIFKALMEKLKEPGK